MESFADYIFLLLIVLFLIQISLPLWKISTNMFIKQGHIPGIRQLILQIIAITLSIIALAGIGYMIGYPIACLEEKIFAKEFLAGRDDFMIFNITISVIAASYVNKYLHILMQKTNIKLAARLKLLMQAWKPKKEK